MLSIIFEELLEELEEELLLDEEELEDLFEDDLAFADFAAFTTLLIKLIT